MRQAGMGEERIRKSGWGGWGKAARGREIERQSEGSEGNMEEGRAGG
jgi:hypothetical protein